MTDKEIELAFIGGLLAEKIVEFQGRIHAHDMRIQGVENALEVLEGLRAVFPDLGPILDLAEAPLKAKEKDLDDGRAVDVAFLEDLEDLKKKYNDSSQAAAVRFFAIINGEKKEITHMSVSMKDNQTLPISIELDDKLGFPTGGAAPADLAWSLSDPSKGDLAVAADLLSAVFTPKALGDCAVQVSIPSLSLLGTSDTITVVGGDVSSIKITLGAPQG